MSDISGIFSDALGRAIEEIDMKQEIDGYAGPGGPSYSEDDIAEMDKTKEGFAEIAAKLAEGHKAVILSPDAYAALAGIVAPSLEGGDHTDVLQGGECVNHDGIFAPWDEIREAFPFKEFKQWVAKREVEESGLGYDPHFGE
jgi:hypothetical protein